MAQFPQEIFEQILIRLDVRDLIRCRSISKSWLSLISDPRFIKAHLEHGYHRDRNNDKIGHRRIVMFCNHSRFRVDNMFFDHHECHLLGSSNGLICVSTSHTEILVINPETRQVNKLKRPQISETKLLVWGFGYDPSIDDYKVILGFRKVWGLTCFQMFTLKSNIWKAIGEVNYSCFTRVGTFCNGALHWIAYHGSPQNSPKAILSFDLSEDKFKEVPQPDDVAFHPLMRLGTMDDCLCIFYRELPSQNIWIMNKYNVKQSWAFAGHEHEIKTDAMHCLKELKHYIPNKRPLCHDMRFIRNVELLGAPIYVPSLVSPHVCRKLNRKRPATRNMRSVVPKTGSCPNQFK